MRAAVDIVAPAVAVIGLERVILGADQHYLLTVLVLWALYLAGLAWLAFVPLAGRWPPGWSRLWLRAIYVTAGLLAHLSA